VREREREERECVCERESVCVRERECVYIYVCEREREREIALKFLCLESKNLESFYIVIYHAQKQMTICVENIFSEKERTELKITILNWYNINTC